MMSFYKKILFHCLIWGIACGFSVAVSQEQTSAPQGSEPQVLEGESWITQDGVHLSASYYPGTAGKESIPVVLLHGKNGSQGDFAELIPELTKKGMAVLVPDLRGHGKSTKKTITGYQDGDAIVPIPPAGGGAFLPEAPAQPQLTYQQRQYLRRLPPLRRQQEMLRMQQQMAPITKDIDIKAEDFKEQDYIDMAEYDLAKLQAFLVFEHNNGQLNLSKLSLVGIDMGAALSVVWAKQNWAPPGGQRPTRYVKNVTMISPVESQITGIFANKTLRESVAYMIIVGQNASQNLEDAKNIHKQILADKEETETGIRSQCPLILCNTEKQGTALFRMEKPNLRVGIPLFIQDRIGKLDDKETKWIRIRDN